LISDDPEKALILISAFFMADALLSRRLA